MSSAKESSLVNLTIGDFGQIADRTEKSTPVPEFNWTNGNNVSVQVIAYGATITSIKVPDRRGQVEDIVLGFANMDGYLNKKNSYIGATIGRCANRINKGRFAIDGANYRLTINDKGNHLHGGFKGFDKVMWDYHVSGNSVTLSYLSADSEEGYPGSVMVNVTFELTANNEFLIDYKAVTNKPTIVNLSNHSYFNLAGHNKGATEIYKHIVSIKADRITEINSDRIPTGNLITVFNTVYDLRTPKVLGDVIQKVPNSPVGFDNNFCISGSTSQGNALVAKVTHPDSGRTLEVYSNQPGVQFYTGNFLPNDNSLVGRGGNAYKKHGGICFHTQMYPDAVNHPQFGKSVLYPGDVYHQTTVFKFLTE